MAQVLVGTTVLRRQIARRFAQLRTKAKLTQEQAAKQLDRGRTTIRRIEEADETVRFRASDVRAMLELYGASQQESELLMALAMETRNGNKSWWHDYITTAMPDWFQLYVSLEDAAETICTYESELIPGLLQTRTYADQILHSGAKVRGEEDTETAERRAILRAERQSVLTRPRAPHLSVILNEAVIRRPVGSGGVMAEQLAHVLAVAQQSNVSVRLVPYKAGLHAGAMAGAFSLLDFPNDPTGEPIEPSLAYVDTLTGALYLNQPDEVRAYRQAWADLNDRALDESTTRDVITQAMKGFDRD